MKLNGTIRRGGRGPGALCTAERAAGGEMGGSSPGTWRAGSLAFYFFLLYALLIWICEFLDLLCWLVGLPQVTVLSRAAALILTGFAGWKVIGIPRTERVKTDIIAVAGSIFIVGFFAVKGIRPDMSYDTYNYHLLSQIPGFLDNLNYHAMPGKFQMFGFRLGDRMFYPFRAVLGLRMGTLLNAAAMLVIYRQVTVFLAWFKDSLSSVGQWEKRAQKPVVRAVWKVLCCPSLLAFLAVCRYDLILQSGSYMVELLALPFLLEMIFLLVREREEAFVKREAFVFCLTGGIFFCLKMTNVVYLAPLVILYIWKIRKDITVPLFFSCLAAGAVPVMIYLIYNGVSTGNPVFPYYNTIFKSKYYPIEDFKDKRWGPLGLQEIFLWPWYMIRYPDYRMSEMACTYNLDLAAGYLAMAALIALGLFKKAGKKFQEYKREMLLIAVYVLSMLAWAVTTGHTRYFMGGILLNGIILMICCLRLFYSGAWLPVLAGAALVLPLGPKVQYGFQRVWQGYEWCMRDDSPASYEANAKWIFRDRELFSESVRQQVDVIFMTWADYGSYARLIGEDVPVYNRNAIVGEMRGIQKEYFKRVENFMREGKGVYDMFPQSVDNLDAYLEWMNKAGYYVEDIFYMTEKLSGPQAFNMARLNMADGRENRWYYAYYDERYGRFQMEKESDRCRMTAIFGDPDWWMNPYPFQIIITASDGVTSKEAGVIDLPGDTEYRKIETELDLTGLSGTITIGFKSSVDGKRGVAVNPVLSPSPDGGEENAGN